MGTLNAIPPQSWELSAMVATGLSFSQLRFAISFLASVPIAIILRFLPTARVRHLYSVLTGLILIYYPFGNGCFHLLLPAAFTYVAMAAFRQHCGTLTWLFVFPYLLMNHVSEASGLAWKEGEVDFTGAQMILTLKLIALAMCYQDGARGKNPNNTQLHAYAKSKALFTLPSPLEYASYLLAAGNLLAGPFFEAKDYLDYIARRGEWNQSDPHHKLPNPIVPGTLRFLKALLCAAIWFQLSPRLNVSMLEAGSWREETWIGARVALLWAAVVVYRFKYYFAWALAESALIFSGLCFAGYDAQGKPVWSRFTNARIRKVEVNESLAELPQHWNIRTGLWLRHYVYDRLPSSSRTGKPGFANMVVTQLVSGLWHGLFPGYWMFFATSAFMFEASKVLYRYEQGWPDKLRKFPLWRLAKTVMTATVLNYSAGPFVVLTLKDSWAVWQSVYFFGHCIVGAILLVGAVMPPRRKRIKAEPKSAAAAIADGGVPVKKSN